MNFGFLRKCFLLTDSVQIPEKKQTRLSNILPQKLASIQFAKIFWVHDEISQVLQT